LWFLGMLIAVTDHAAERFRQRVRGTLDERNEIRHAVARGIEHREVEQSPGGEWLVRDPARSDVIYVCRRDRDELVVITLWEEGERPAVPRLFTDALRRDDHRAR
jgi:hypothetical protein